MSGGYFNYDQYKLEDMANEIEKLIAHNPKSYQFGEETIAKFQKAILTLRQAGVMAQRIDWLVSGDDGEEAFHERWEEDLNKMGKGESC